MSALRDLFASLWTALLLRGRLLGIRLRRLFGRAPKAGPGIDYHLTKGETPVEGIDYDPADLPPELATRLAATRADLLAHAPRAPAAESPSRRRLRTASAVLTSALALGVVAAGASALVAGSTGVPAVDKLLGIYEVTSESDKSGQPGPVPGDARPDPNRPTASIEVGAADGSRVASAFYAASSGRICVATADAGDVPSGEREIGALACQAPADIAKRLEQRGGYLMATNVTGDDIVLRGFVGREVASVSGRGPYGPLEVSLGGTWRPNLPGLVELRPFVAVGSRGGEASQMAGDLQALSPSQYSFEAVTGSSDRIQIKP